ncbi:MAG: UDP-2,3-diacylglucosamine diphosphatase LpxI [Pirellulales bacterium]
MGERIGLVAGWGRYPVVVADTLRAQGHQVYCLAVRQHAEPEKLRGHVDDLRIVGVARLGAAIRYFRRHGIRQATMAGKIHKVQLFRRFAFLHSLPDLRAVRVFWSHFVTRKADCRDDTLLGAIVRAYAEEGIVFAPATDFAPELLVPAGHLAGPQLTDAQRRDVAFGWRVAKELGRLDIGQSVAIRGQAVLAVEAVEGTDECIRRAGQLCRQGKFVVVKVAKPKQDMRFDVPTVGVQTLETLRSAGGRVLAVEAGSTIVVDRDVVCEFAQRHGITLVAVTDPAADDNAALELS